jgi:hypothetical protein
MKTKNRGLTLIETVLYTALFSLFMTSVLVMSWELVVSMEHERSRITIQEEGNFVVQKIHGVLQNLEVISHPASAASSSVLIVYTSNNMIDPIRLRLNTSSSSIEMQRENMLGFLPLTTRNVVVQDLVFTHVPPYADIPAGVRVMFVIEGETFITEAYIHK